MLSHSKKLLTAIVESFDNSREEESTWHVDGDTVRVTPAGAIYDQWRAWRQHGVLSEPGGWNDQPLTTLVRLEAIELVYQTATYLQQEKADWSKFSATQRYLISALEMA